MVLVALGVGNALRGHLYAHCRACDTAHSRAEPSCRLGNKRGVEPMPTDERNACNDQYGSGTYHRRTRRDVRVAGSAPARSAHGVPCWLSTRQDAGTESLPKVILELRCAQLGYGGGPRPSRSGGPGLLGWFVSIQMTARRGVQLLAPLVRAFSPVQQCTPAVRSLPCLQLPLRCFASDADLKKTPLYDFHVEHGGEACTSLVGWISPKETSWVPDQPQMIFGHASVADPAHARDPSPRY